MAKEKFISGEQFREMHRAKQLEEPNVTINKRTILYIAAALVLCIISFTAGINYQNHSSKPTQGVASNGSGFSGGFRRSGGFGQVSAVAVDSLTVTNTRSGVATTYSITPSTVITDAGQPADITAVSDGSTVIVGTSGTGSTVATTIAVNPSFNRPTAAPIN